MQRQVSEKCSDVAATKRGSAAASSARGGHVIFFDERIVRRAGSRPPTDRDRRSTITTHSITLICQPFRAVVYVFFMRPARNEDPREKRSLIIGTLASYRCVRIQARALRCMRHCQVRHASSREMNGRTKALTISVRENLAGVIEPHIHEHDVNVAIALHIARGRPGEALRHSP